jgi:hypothetical protein
MDIVYTLGVGSKYKNHELRFSLRSVEKFLTGYGKVWIVGECPDWVRNANHIPAADSGKNPDHSIMLKITEACNHPEVSDDFLFFNDDHFLLSAFSAPEFPYYYHGNLTAYVKNRGLDGYGRRANNTLQNLTKRDLPSKYFDVHTPIRYNKKTFLETVTSQPWDRTADGFIIKSLYANALNIEGIEIKDGKLNSLPGKDVNIFSTYPHVKSAIWRFLQEQFPKMSNFEHFGI